MLGCDVIGQHCDSTAPATAAEKAGVFHVGYNSDMRDAAPNASLTSAVWDWSQYLTYAVECVMNGEAIDVDWSKGLADGVCDISPLNEAIIADGTQEAIDAARAKIVSGDWDVFTGPLVDVDGNTVVAEGETFHEPASAPSITWVLQGITVVE
ncbi:MAG: BMP family ABC transporter substrate-binding protein [Lachnospiraceae bacterium]